MPYLITITNNGNANKITIEFENYSKAYRGLCNIAQMYHYPVHSIHGENLVTAGTLHTEYFICMEQIKLNQ